MPVRSLNSPVLKWPDARAVDHAVRRWAERVAAAHPEVAALGYFGSYARGDWGPGSDLDIVMVVQSSEEVFARRAARWDTTELPVPADLLVYTREEWQNLDRAGRFYREVAKKTVWVWFSP